MTYETEFPDYELDLIIPNSWRDASWHNDTCPSWITQCGTLQIYTDYQDPADREFTNTERFAVLDLTKAKGPETVFISDSWEDTQWFVANRTIDALNTDKGLN